MSASSVEPMRKPTKVRDFDKSASTKARRFKKRSTGENRWDGFMRENAVVERQA